MLLASFFNKKAKKWRIGRNNWQIDLTKKINKNEKYCWFHCASAGEFEQAIPLIKDLRFKNSDSRIAVSFFSPSGMEMYKDSGLADLFFNFPLDTNRNAEKLIEILNPDFVIFIRNEIWWNSLISLKQKKIPIYLVNANLEQKRNFFYQIYLNKSYPLFTKIFDTKKFGNTKSERVIENKNNGFKDEVLEDFCRASFVIIIGSSYKKEEEYIHKFYTLYKSKISNLKIIIAPHDFNSTKKIELGKLFNEKIISYSNYKTLNAENSILFLDKIGILKYAYRYSNIAFIGGGFNKSVHNITEAAVYGITTIFGSNYQKSEEVEDLVNLNLAFPVGNYNSFETKLLKLIDNPKMVLKLKIDLDNYFLNQEKNSKKIISIILKE